MSNTIDPSKCPLCGNANLCGEVKNSSNKTCGGENSLDCWCKSVDFSKTLLDSVPEQARRKACICQQCAQRLAVTL